MSLHPAFRTYLDELNPLVEKAAREGFVPTPESARAALAGLNAYALPVAPVAHVGHGALQRGLELGAKHGGGFLSSDLRRATRHTEGVLRRAAYSEGSIVSCSGYCWALARCIVLVTLVSATSKV